MCSCFFLVLHSCTEWFGVSVNLLNIMTVVCHRVWSAGDNVTIRVHHHWHHTVSLKSILFVILVILSCIYLYSCCCTWKLDTSTNGNYRNPLAFSSALAKLRMLQPRVLWFLNCVVPLVSASNYYTNRQKSHINIHPRVTQILSKISNQEQCSLMHEDSVDL